MPIDKFFAVIRKGAWHSIDQLSDQLALPTSKLIEFAKFLSERGMLKFEEKTQRIKIEPIWKLLLPTEESTEPKPTIATFIIPPETSINVQSTHISNLSNIELEVNLRINDKIKEVAIKA